MNNFSVVILTGGQSKRFRRSTGQEKFEYSMDNQPLIIHQITKLSEMSDKIHISIKFPRQKEQIMKILEQHNLKVELQFLFDNTSLIDLKGPYLGIVSTLHQIRNSEFILFLPIDYPFVRVKDYQQLLNSCKENHVEVTSYALPDGQIASSLLCLNTEIAWEKIELMKNPPNSRLSGIFRGSQSVGLNLIDRSSHQFVNLNRPVDRREIYPVNPESLQIIRPDMSYWLFVKSLQNHDTNKSCKYLLKEKQVWKNKYILSHIDRDIAKYC